MPGKENTTVTTTKISTRGQVIIALLGLIGTLTLGYWQFVLKPREQSGSVDVVYAGRVVDMNDQLPISGAKITFYLNGIPRFAYTDSEGLYQFAVAINSLGSGQIRVDADGYQPYTRNITLSASTDYVEDIRLVRLISAIPSETSLPVSVNTNTETPDPTFTSIATLTASPEPTSDVADQLIKLIDNYYICLNSATPNDGDDSDYEVCWNLLSDRPGEFQSNLNKNNYLAQWKKYKVTYALFYCSKNVQGRIQHFVHTRYLLYDRNDDSHPISNGAYYYLEYLFAHDEEGWRIKGANDNISDIGSFCEREPRINKLEP